MNPIVKPWVGYRIARFGDSAIVTIARYWFEDDGPVRSETLQEYETASRGATASARRAVAYVSGR